MRRLKPCDVKAYREERLAKVGGVCELCGLPLTKENAVLDHSHEHGWIRGVLQPPTNGESAQKTADLHGTPELLASLYVAVHRPRQ